MRNRWIGEIIANKSNSLSAYGNPVKFLNGRISNGYFWSDYSQHGLDSLLLPWLLFPLMSCS